MCCAQLAGNARPKKSPYGHHHTTLSQLRHVSTIGEKPVKQLSPPHVLTIWWSSAYWQVRSVGEFEAPLQISTGFASWHGTLVVGVSQTLHRWIEGATYIRQGGHHLGTGPHLKFLLYSSDCSNCTSDHNVGMRPNTSSSWKILSMVKLSCDTKNLLTNTDGVPTRCSHVLQHFWQKSKDNGNN